MSNVIVPTTDEVRDYVVIGGEPRPWLAPDDPDEARRERDRAAAFDAWLATVKAEAWDEGFRAAGLLLPADPPRQPSNPYREPVENTEEESNG